MSGPDKCEWCGLHEISDLEGVVYFACGSSWCDISGVWEQSTGCGEILDLRQRIADAVGKAQRAIRFGLAANSSIRCVFAGDMDRVVDILQGNSPEIPDSSNSPANLESSS
jgi:hypothetical protein